MVADLIHPLIAVIGDTRHIVVQQGEVFDLRLRGTKGRVRWTEENDPVLDHIEEPGGLVSHITAAAVGTAILRIRDQATRLRISVTVRKRPSDVSDEAATLGLTADQPVDQTTT